MAEEEKQEAEAEAERAREEAAKITNEYSWLQLRSSLNSLYPSFESSDLNKYCAFTTDGDAGNINPFNDEI